MLVVDRSNSSVFVVCSECNTSSDYTVRVGEEPDYESLTAYLCEKCLHAAVNLLEDYKNVHPNQR